MRSCEVDSSKPINKLPTVAIAAICIGYLAVRLWGLTDSCLWFDEIFSVHAAGHSWTSILGFVSLDLIHPPLFYVLLKLWIGIGGESVFWLRLFPVIFSVIAIFPFLSLCRELKLGKWTQVVALFLLAINGSLIKYAQEVRMYSLLMCLSLFSIWLFARYFVKGKSFIPLVIVNVLMVYTHYFGWFVVLSEVLLIVWFQPIKWRRIVVMFGITLACFLPWAIAVVLAARSGSGLEQNIGWMARPGIRLVITFVLNILEPFYFQTSSAEPISILQVTIPLLLIVIVAAVLYLANWQKLDQHERRHAYFLLLFIKLPVVITFLASWLLPYSMWGTRHLIIVVAPLCIFAAMMLTLRSVKWLPATAVGLVLLFAGYGLVVRAGKDAPQNSWCSWGPVAEKVLAVEKASIYVVEDLSAYHVWYSNRAGPTVAVRKVTGIDGVLEDKAYFLPRGFDGVRSVDISAIDEPRIWLIYRAPHTNGDESRSESQRGTISTTGFRLVALNEAEPPVRNFVTKGYQVDQERIVTVSGENVLAVLLFK